MLKSTLRAIALAGVFALPVIIPFIVSASLFFPYITGKNFTFRIIVEGAFCAWAVLVFLDTRYRPRFSWILASLTLFVGVVALADLHGINVFRSFWSNFERMEGWVTLFHVWLYFLVASSLLESRTVRDAFLYTTLVSSVAVAFMALTPITQALFAGKSIASVPRIDGTFGNPIYLAVYALFHTFFAFILMVRMRGKEWWRFFALGVVALLQVLVMVLSLTRGTVFGFAGGVGIALILIALFEKERPRVRLVAGGFLLVLFLALGSLVTLRTTEYAKTNPLLNRFTQIHLDSGTLHARFLNWGVAWQGIKERPILGWGQDGYEYVFAKHFDPHMYGEEPWFDRTHSIVFDWLIAGGFVALLSYFFIPLALIAHIWFLGRKKHGVWHEAGDKNDHWSVTERALWTGLLVAYMVHNLFVFDNLVSYLFYATLLAGIHARVSVGRTPLCKKEVREDTVYFVVAPLALVVFVGAVWYVNLPGIRTAQALILASSGDEYMRHGGPAAQTGMSIMRSSYNEALSYDFIGRQEVRERMFLSLAGLRDKRGVSEEMRAEFATAVVAELEKEVARTPYSPRLMLFLGSAYLEQGDLAKAEDAFRRAVALGPEKQTSVFQLAMVLFYENKNDEARDLLKHAFESVPEYDEARTFYAMALIRTGAYEQAKSLLKERYGTSAYDDERLLTEWRMAKQYEVALEIMQNRVIQKPDDVQAAVSLAGLYRDMGRKDDAVKVLEAVRKAYPAYTKQINEFMQQVRGW